MSPRAAMARPPAGTVPKGESVANAVTGAKGLLVEKGRTAPLAQVVGVVIERALIVIVAEVPIAEKGIPAPVVPVARKGAR